MNSSLVQLLVLAGIAIFLVLRLKNVLGTREGFEKPPEAVQDSTPVRREFEVIEGGPDRDITDHAEEGSAQADALAQMKAADPSFSVNEFLGGASGAYEMILMAFEAGDMDSIKGFLSDDVFESFDSVVKMREEQGLSVDATFVGVREMRLKDATYNASTTEGEVTVKFVAELTSVVTNAEDEVVEGSAKEIKRQKDTWTFARVMSSDDPNWQLVATGE
ncbi:Tim44/TimA family putative adaptor protein [Nereida ignava]|uniref:Tim44/TimA family putative adaptor protein n=1 Tax=Nereida ignava TaxID=282199 RepID=UPI0030FA76BA